METKKSNEENKDWLASVQPLSPAELRTTYGGTIYMMWDSKTNKWYFVIKK
jgi:hypothetical protein